MSEHWVIEVCQGGSAYGLTSEKGYFGGHQMKGLLGGHAPALEFPPFRGPPVAVPAFA